MPQRVYQVPSVKSFEDPRDYRAYPRTSSDQYQLTAQSAYPLYSQKPVMNPSEYQPPSTQRRVDGTSYSSTVDPVYNDGSFASQYQKQQDMARKRREMQDKLKRDAEDYKKKQQEKEQKKREEYVQRHKFMFPDLFGGNKLRSSESFNGSLQPEINNVPVDPDILRNQQAEVRRKMQEEYDIKARKPAEKKKQDEETKRAQQAESAAKTKAEEDKYKVGRQNTTPDVITHREPAVKLSENGAIRKTQDQCIKIGTQHNSCNTDDRNNPSQVRMKKLLEQEMNEKHLKFQEKMEAHYKYGRLPDVASLRLRSDSVNNTVKKHLEKELESSGDAINKVEEIKLTDGVASVNDKNPVDKEKEFREEMIRARLRMQEIMNLKIQEFQAKSKQEADLP